MKLKAQQLALEKLCNWNPEKTDIWVESLGGKCGYYKNTTPPDFLRDLNAVHEVEKMLTADQAWRMHQELSKLCGVAGGMGSGTIDEWVWHATAAQRVEALLRVKGLWEEE